MGCLKTNINGIHSAPTILRFSHRWARGKYGTTWRESGTILKKSGTDFCGCCAKSLPKLSSPAVRGLFFRDTTRSFWFWKNTTDLLSFLAKAGLKKARHSGLRVCLMPPGPALRLLVCVRTGLSGSPTGLRERLILHHCPLPHRFPRRSPLLRPRHPHSSSFRFGSEAAQECAGTGCSKYFLSRPR